MCPEYKEVIERLKAAGEWMYARGLPDHPVFKSAPLAAEHLLGYMPADATLLVMRDQALAPLREQVLRSGRRLVVPEKGGAQVFNVPSEALGRGRFHGDTAKERGVLKLGNVPKGSKRYSGTVTAVLVACLAFDPTDPYLYGFDTERVALTLEQLREGSSPGFILTDTTPVICLAADCQEVSNWPARARSYVTAHAVVTSSRFVRLPQATLN